MHHWGLKKRMRSSLWDADHILPVVEGGGECELKNLRTLCLRCHRAATIQLRERLRRAKVAKTGGPYPPSLTESLNYGDAVVMIDSSCKPPILL
jgi:5-methylcytosine-specific restriction endonuclease McrA